METNYEEKIIKIFLKEEEIGFDSYNYRKNKFFEMTSKEFLNFSQTDLKNNSKKGTINSISNTKRAIDLQVSSLLIILGYYTKSKKEKWSFPKKLEFLNSLGIITTTMMKNCNATRNKLEHEFKIPTKKEAEEFQEIAELFIDSTERILRIKDISFFFDTYKKRIFPKSKKTEHLTGISLTYNNEQRLFTFIPEWSKDTIIDIKTKKTVEYTPNKNFNHEYFIKENHNLFKKLLKRYVELIKKN